MNQRVLITQPHQDVRSGPQFRSQPWLFALKALVHLRHDRRQVCLARNGMGPLLFNLTNRYVSITADIPGVYAGRPIPQ
ncbi:MAG TPA: hypothetical protein VFA18_25790 [Gemmataceae bacterium]|nr:hypothetical protein [Gemmataceae bacterium]